MERYQVQARLIGVEGQRRIRDGHVVIVGCGALGIPVALYLAGAGVGKLTLIDGDNVDITNLHRQPLYTEDHLGLPKVEVLKNHLERFNSSIEIEAYSTYLTAENIDMIIPSACVLVEAGDNFELTYLLNDYAYLRGLPLVYGAIYQNSGMVATFGVTEERLNFRDLFDSVDVTMCNCAEAGVLGPTAGVIGSLMAQEVVSYLVYGDSPFSNNLLLYDAKGGKFQTVKYRPNPSNPLRQGYAPALQVKGLEVSWEEYFQQKAKGVLVDIRSEEERELYPYPEAYWTPFPIEEIEKMAQEKKEKLFFCFCETGKRSAWLVRSLREKGILNVYSIQGGIQSLRKMEKIE